MPYASFKILPGVDQNKTPALNEAAVSQSQLIRFIPDRTLGGLVQKLGGWSKFIQDDIGSVIRCLWAWEDTNANSYLAVGAEGIPAGGGAALEVIESGGITDITPQKTTVNIQVSFSTTAGSNAVVVTDPGRNADDYDAVDIQTQISVGGLVLFGLYQVFNPSGSANTYTIYATDRLGDPALATSTVTNGGSVPQFFATTGSDFVTVKLNDHGYVAGETFPVLVPLSLVGGITLSGNYTIREITSADEFVISASTTASSIPINSIVGDGSSVTVTHSTDVIFTSGENVQIFDVDPSAYDGTWLIFTSNNGFFEYADSTVASYITGGYVSGNYSFFENSGNARMVYYNGIGPLPAGTGYGIGPYGSGGYGTGNPPVPGTGTPINAVDWTLDNWGEVLIACPLNGPIYTWNPTLGDPVALVIPGGPSINQGMFVAMPQRQVIAWGSTFTGISDPLLIRWSDVNDYTQWTGLLTNQAGSYRIPKGSRIVQCIQGPQQGLIWTDLAIWAMQYAGPPYVYQFNELGTGCGLIGRKAAGAINGIVYWMGQSQFFRLAGSGVEPIRCPIWDVVFQDLDTSNLEKIRFAANSRFGEVTWYYPTVSNGGEVSHYVKYNILLDQWDFGALARTAWINESVLGPPIGAGTDTYIYQHETSPDADGQPMLSSFQTGYFVMTEGNVKMFVDQVWPDMKWGYYGGTQGANVKMTFYVTDYPGQTPEVYGPFTMTQASTFFTPRFRGRLVSIKIESDDIGSFWRLGNIRYRVQEDGRF